MLPLGTDLESRRERWRRFFEPSADPGFLFLVNSPAAEEELPPPPPLRPYATPARIDYHVACYEQMVRRAAAVPDDRLPYLPNSTGTEIFAEAFGCPVHHEEGMPFALPRVHSREEAAAVKVPRLEDSTLAAFLDMASAQQEKTGPAALQKLVDIQSPMDIAALIWNKADLFMAMIDSPNAVHELATKVRELLCAFFDAWFERFGTAHIAHHPEYFMADGMTLSEDEVGAVNAEMFEEFFRPHLVALSERYGGIGIHCCADSAHQWEQFRTLPGLRLLNLACPPTSTHEAFTWPAYRFFESTCVQMHSGTPTEGFADWPGPFPAGARVVLQFNVDSLDAARALAERLNEIRCALTAPPLAAV